MLPNASGLRSRGWHVPERGEGRGALATTPFAVLRETRHPEILSALLVGLAMLSVGPRVAMSQPRLGVDQSTLAQAGAAYMALLEVDRSRPNCSSPPSSIGNAGRCRKT